MPVVTFAHGRSQLPAPGAIAIAGGNLTGSGTLYLSLQGANRVGLNRPSALTTVSYSPGQQIQLTLPATARQPAEDWQYWVISASATNDPAALVQIATIPCIDSDGLPTPLPTTLTLSREAHIALSAIVDDPDNLPSDSDLINGMLRGIADFSTIFEYHETSIATPDGLTVLNATVGRWHRIGSFSTYITDTSGPDGCAQEISTDSTTRITPNVYAVDGALSPPVRYWLLNDGISEIPRGTRVGLNVIMAGADKSLLFHNLLRLTFKGFANPTTGELDTNAEDGQPMTGLNAQTNYTAKRSNLILQKSLAPGQTYALDVQLAFASYQLQGLVPQGSNISVNPFFYAQAGEYNEAGSLVGDSIAADQERRRIVPQTGRSVLALVGSGMVDSFSFKEVGQQQVFNLAANQADQKLCITGNGDVFLADTVPDNAAIRAVVGTVAGVSSAGPASSYVSAASNSALTITCSYPFEASTQTGRIRSDYPDVIAGNAKGKFNPATVVIYVQRQSTSEVCAFSGNLALADTSQQIVLMNWSSGTVIGSIPQNTNPKFSLYAPGSCAVVATTGGSFPADSYRVSFAFSYDGNQITSISHDTNDGCLYEAGGTLAEMLQHLARRDNPHGVTCDQINALPVGTLTDAIAEGDDNLYYTHDRVDARIALADDLLKRTLETLFYA